MLLDFTNLKFKYVLVTDIEFDNFNILQCAGMLFEKTLKNKYKLHTSFNFYIKRDKVGKYAEKYTGINPQFLLDNGIEFSEFKERYDTIMSEVDLNDTLFVSHGTKNDRLVLKKSGISNLPSHSYCTYKNAAKILKRDNKLKLSDVANEAGFITTHNHDAFYDVVATTVVFSFLKEREES